MKKEIIIDKLLEAGLYEFRFEFDEVGPKVIVRIPNTNGAIAGYLPIDDDYDEKFANFLIKKVYREVEKIEKRKEVKNNARSRFWRKNS